MEERHQPLAPKALLPGPADGQVGGEGREREGPGAGPEAAERDRGRPADEEDGDDDRDGRGVGHVQVEDHAQAEVGGGGVVSDEVQARPSRTQHRRQGAAGGHRQGEQDPAEEDPGAAPRGAQGTNLGGADGGKLQVGRN